NVIQSAPNIREPIYGGSARISGRFGEQEARGLASVLENPLQTPVSIEEERSVSPTLGMDSIRASIMAGLLGLAITMICVLIYYRLPGLVANLALIVNLILLIGALTMFRFVLTLPGIAGIILTIGLSVDASVLIYERLREEMALGKSLKLALSLAGATSFYIKGEKNFGVDFRGGDLITLSSPAKIDIGQVRDSLKPLGFADASIQESAQGGKNYITIRTPLNTSDKVEKQV